MLEGHGRELVREPGIDSWTLSSQVNLLLHSVSDGLMGRHERLVQLLALEVKVTGRGYHAQDHEGFPYEGTN